MSRNRVIMLRGEAIQNEEGVAGEAGIIPGMLVQGVTTILKHATAGGSARRTFAMERDEAGRDIDEAYEVDSVVKVGSFFPGQRVNTIIASGQNIAEGAALESAGDGTVKVFAAGVKIGYATEAVNNSAGPSYARLAMEVY